MVKRKRAKADYIQLNVRMKESLRREIEKAANRNGVSMNAEVVNRLQLSFAKDDRVGGPHLEDLVETIAMAMTSAGELAGFLEAHKPMKQGQWLALPYARDQAIRAAIALLKYHRPPPDEIVMPKWETTEVVGGDPKQAEEWTRQMYEDLGELVAEKQFREREEEK
jgi:hypothetical protein